MKQGCLRSATLAVVITIMLLALLALGAGPVFAASTAPLAFSADELVLVDLINDYREAHGLCRLLISDQLTDSARKHSSDMAKYGFTGHVSLASDWFPAGTTAMGRMAECGYAYETCVGEVCGYGTLYHAQEVFDGWCGSPLHNTALLGANFKVMGVGLAEGGDYGHYWTVDFGGYVPPTAQAAAGGGGEFADVPAGHAYYQAIRHMAAADIIQGYATTEGTSSSEFRPDDPVKRAQLAKMVVGALKLEVGEHVSCPFTDLGADDPSNYYPNDFVAAAYQEGVILGVGPTSFAPWEDVTRTQVVTMVVRAIQNLYPDFLRTPPSGYTNTWGVRFDAEQGPLARIAEYNGLLAGLPLTGAARDPWGAMPRGEVAQVLWSVMQKLELQ